MNNWSVDRSEFDDIIIKYPLISLSKILVRSKIPTQINDSSTYKRITVRLYGQGVIQRDEVQGSNIGTKRQFLAKPGQLIISRIDARNGAFGIVPSDLNNAIVTNDFWLFDVYNAIPQYLMFVLSTNTFQAYWQTKSSGTTNRQRVQETSFLETKIPLPSIEEQKRLVSKYNVALEQAKKEEIAANKAELSLNETLFKMLGIECKSSNNMNGFLLRTTCFEEITQWGYDKIATPFPFLFKKYRPYSINSRPELAKEFFRGKSPKYDKNGEFIILNQKCNRWNEIDTSFAKPVNSEWLSKINSELFTRTGDIIINSTGEGTLGRASLIKETAHIGLMIDSHMLLLRVNPKFIIPQLFVYIFNSTFGQQQVEILKGAQATKQTELGIENLRKFLLPLPPIDTQIQIASVIERIATKSRNCKERARFLRQTGKSEFENSIFARKT